jgi:hypothetical protein
MQSHIIQKPKSLTLPRPPTASFIKEGSHNRNRGRGRITSDSADIEDFVRRERLQRSIFDPSNGETRFETGIVSTRHTRILNRKRIDSIFAQSLPMVAVTIEFIEARTRLRICFASAG